MTSGTISILSMGTTSASFNSKKSTTKLNGPHFSEFEDFEFNSRFRNSTLRVS
jgi:hypothetical protein